MQAVNPSLLKQEAKIRIFSREKKAESSRGKPDETTINFPEQGGGSAGWRRKYNGYGYLPCRLRHQQRPRQIWTALNGTRSYVQYGPQAW